MQQLKRVSFTLLFCYAIICLNNGLGFWFFTETYQKVKFLFPENYFILLGGSPFSVIAALFILVLVFLCVFSISKVTKKPRSLFDDVTYSMFFISIGLMVLSIFYWQWVTFAPGVSFIALCMVLIRFLKSRYGISLAAIIHCVVYIATIWLFAYHDLSFKHFSD